MTETLSVFHPISNTIVDVIVHNCVCRSFRFHVLGGLAPSKGYWRDLGVKPDPLSSLLECTSQPYVHACVVFAYLHIIMCASVHVLFITTFCQHANRYVQH